MKMIQTETFPLVAAVAARTRSTTKWAALILLGMAASSQATVTVGFEESEGYALQTFTQNTNLNHWRFQNNAKISAAQHYSGSQSLELSTTAGTAIFTPPAPTDETYQSFSWSFLSTGTRVNGARTSHAYLFVGNDDTANLGAIQFSTYYGPSPSAANRLYYTTWSSTGAVNTGNYVEVEGLDLTEWNTLTFTLDPTQQTYSLSLNGSPVAGIQNIALSSTWNNPSHLSTIWLNSPTNNLTVYYDDVILKAIPEPGSLALLLGVGAFWAGTALWTRKSKRSALPKTSGNETEPSLPCS